MERAITQLNGYIGGKKEGGGEDFIPTVSRGAQFGFYGHQPEHESVGVLVIIGNKNCEKWELYLYSLTNQDHTLSYKRLNLWE